MAPISGVSSNAHTTDTSSTQKTANSLSTPSQSMFLQLLVAQIKNQDPSQPADGTQFVAQLAQFSELEQVIGIRQDLDAMKAAAEAQSTNPVSN